MARKRPARGTCKTVRRKNGCTIKLCYTGRGATGWTFKKGTGWCPSNKRRKRHKRRSQ